MHGPAFLNHAYRRSLPFVNAVRAEHAWLVGTQVDWQAPLTMRMLLAVLGKYDDYKAQVSGGMSKSGPLQA